MIPAAFGAILQGIRSLDSHLDPDTLAALDGEDIAACWKTAGEICDAAGDLHRKLRQTLVERISATSHRSPS